MSSSPSRHLRRRVRNVVSNGEGSSSQSVHTSESGERDVVEEPVSSDTAQVESAVVKLGLADEHATGNPKRVAGWLLNSLLQKAGSATSVASSPSFEEYRQAQAYSKTLCALCTKFFVADEDEQLMTEEMNRIKERESQEAAEEHTFEPAIKLIDGILRNLVKPRLSEDSEAVREQLDGAINFLYNKLEDIKYIESVADLLQSIHQNRSPMNEKLVWLSLQMCVGWKAPQLFLETVLALVRFGERGLPVELNKNWGLLKKFQKIPALSSYERVVQDREQHATKTVHVIKDQMSIVPHDRAKECTQSFIVDFFGAVYVLLHWAPNPTTGQEIHTMTVTRLEHGEFGIILCDTQDIFLEEDCVPFALLNLGLGLAILGRDAEGANKGSIHWLDPEMLESMGSFPLEPSFKVPSLEQLCGSSTPSEDRKLSLVAADPMNMMICSASMSLSRVPKISISSFLVEMPGAPLVAHKQFTTNRVNFSGIKEIFAQMLPQEGTPVMELKGIPEDGSQSTRIVHVNPNDGSVTQSEGVDELVSPDIIRTVELDKRYWAYNRRLGTLAYMAEEERQEEESVPAAVLRRQKEIWTPEEMPTSALRVAAQLLNGCAYVPSYVESPSMVPFLATMLDTLLHLCNEVPPNSDDAFSVLVMLFDCLAITNQLAFNQKSTNLSGHTDLSRVFQGLEPLEERMSSSDDPAERAIGGMVVTLRLRLFGLTFSSAEIANQLASSCSAASSDLERQRTLAILKFANKNPSTLRRLFLSASENTEAGNDLFSFLLHLLQKRFSSDGLNDFEEQILDELVRACCGAMLGSTDLSRHSLSVRFWLVRVNELLSSDQLSHVQRVGLVRYFNPILSSICVHALGSIPSLKELSSLDRFDEAEPLSSNVLRFWSMVSQPLVDLYATMQALPDLSSEDFASVINQLPDAAWNPWLPSMPKIERELSMTGSSCGLVSMVEAVIITGPALLLAEVSRNKGELGRFADVKFFVGSSLGKEGLDLHASAHLDQSGMKDPDAVDESSILEESAGLLRTSSMYHKDASESCATEPACLSPGLALLNRMLYRRLCRIFPNSFRSLYFGTLSSAEVDDSGEHPEEVFVRFMMTNHSKPSGNSLSDDCEVALQVVAIKAMGLVDEVYDMVQMVCAGSSEVAAAVSRLWSDISNLCRVALGRRKQALVAELEILQQEEDAPDEIKTEGGRDLWLERKWHSVCEDFLVKCDLLMCFKHNHKASADISMSPAVSSGTNPFSSNSAGQVGNMVATPGIISMGHNPFNITTGSENGHPVNQQPYDKVFITELGKFLARNDVQPSLIFDHALRNQEEVFYHSHGTKLLISLMRLAATPKCYQLAASPQPGEGATTFSVRILWMVARVLLRRLLSAGSLVVTHSPHDDFPYVVSLLPSMRLLDAFLKGLPYAKPLEVAKLSDNTDLFFAEVAKLVRSSEKLFTPALGVMSVCTLGSHLCPEFVELLTSPPHQEDLKNQELFRNLLRLQCLSAHSYALQELLAKGPSQKAVAKNAVTLRQFFSSVLKTVQQLCCPREYRGKLPAEVAEEELRQLMEDLRLLSTLVHQQMNFARKLSADVPHSKQAVSNEVAVAALPLLDSVANREALCLLAEFALNEDLDVEALILGADILSHLLSHFNPEEVLGWKLSDGKLLVKALLEYGDPHIKKTGISVSKSRLSEQGESIFDLILAKSSRGDPSDHRLQIPNQQADALARERTRSGKPGTLALKKVRQDAATSGHNRMLPTLEGETAPPSVAPGTRKRHLPTGWMGKAEIEGDSADKEHRRRRAKETVPTSSSSSSETAKDASKEEGEKAETASEVGPSEGSASSGFGAFPKSQTPVKSFHPFAVKRRSKSSSSGRSPLNVASNVVRMLQNLALFSEEWSSTLLRVVLSQRNLLSPIPLSLLEGRLAEEVALLPSKPIFTAFTAPRVYGRGDVVFLEDGSKAVVLQEDTGSGFRICKLSESVAFPGAEPRPIHEVKYDSLHRASFDNTALMHLRPPSGVQAEVVQHLQRLLCGSLSEGRVEEEALMLSVVRKLEQQQLRRVHRTDLECSTSASMFSASLYQVDASSGLISFSWPSSNPCMFWTPIANPIPANVNSYFEVEVVKCSGKPRLRCSVGVARPDAPVALTEVVKHPSVGLRIGCGVLTHARGRDGPRVGYFTIDGHLVSAYDLFDGEYVPCVALEGQDVQLKICDLNEERMDAHLARVFLFGADEEYRTYFRHICERDELLVDQSRHLEVLSHVVDQHSALSVDPNFLATLVSIARDFEVQIFARSSSVFHFDFEEDCFEDFSKRMKLVVKLLVQLSHKAEELKLDSMAEVLVLGRVLIEELDRRQLEASNVESSLKRLVSHIQENASVPSVLLVNSICSQEQQCDSFASTLEMLISKFDDTNLLRNLSVIKTKLNTETGNSKLVRNILIKTAFRRVAKSVARCLRSSSVSGDEYISALGAKGSILSKGNSAVISGENSSVGVMSGAFEMVNKKENPSAEVVVPPILHAVDREMATADHLPPLFDPNIHDKMVLSMESETVDTAEPMSTSELASVLGYVDASSCSMHLDVAEGTRRFEAFGTHISIPLSTLELSCPASDSVSIPLPSLCTVQLSGTSSVAKGANGEPFETLLPPIVDHLPPHVCREEGATIRLHSGCTSNVIRDLFSPEELRMVWTESTAFRPTVPAPGIRVAVLKKCDVPAGCKGVVKRVDGGEAIVEFDDSLPGMRDMGGVCKKGRGAAVDISNLVVLPLYEQNGLWPKGTTVTMGAHSNPLYPPQGASGVVCIVLSEEDGYPQQIGWVGVQWENWYEGHSMGGICDERNGFFVPPNLLVRKSSVRERKRRSAAPAGGPLVVGDRVTVTVTFSQLEAGSQGRVVQVNGGSIGVDWDIGMPGFHNCSSNAREGHGWYVESSSLTKLAPEVEIEEEDSGASSSGVSFDLSQIPSRMSLSKTPAVARPPRLVQNKAPVFVHTFIPPSIHDSIPEMCQLAFEHLRRWSGPIVSEEMASMLLFLSEVHGNVFFRGLRIDLSRSPSAFQLLSIVELMANCSFLAGNSRPRLFHAFSLGATNPLELHCHDIPIRHEGSSEASSIPTDEYGASSSSSAGPSSSSGSGLKWAGSETMSLLEKVAAVVQASSGESSSGRSTTTLKGFLTHIMDAESGESTCSFPPALVDEFPVVGKRSSRECVEHFKLLWFLNKAFGDIFAGTNQRSAAPHLADALDLQQIMALVNAVGSVNALKEALFPRIKAKIMTTAMTKFLESKVVCPVNEIRVNRIAAAEGRSPSVFEQVFSAMKRLFWGAWKGHEQHFKGMEKLFSVKLEGERAIDAGGPYRETVSHICQELQSSRVSLLIPTPNSMHSVGGTKGQFMPNPAAVSKTSMDMLFFLGIMLGYGIVNEAPLPLDLPRFFYQKLLGEAVTPQDYMSSIDTLSWMDSLQSVLDAECTFSIPSSNPDFGLNLLPEGQSQRVTEENFEEFRRLALAARMAEFDAQVEAIRNGIAVAIPIQEYSLLTHREFEVLACGDPELSVEQLRQICSVSLPGPQEAMFWQCMESFSAEDRCNFLRFATGYRRAPSEISASWRGALSVSSGGRQDSLPQGATCSSHFSTPTYSSVERMMEQYRVAFACSEIDAD